MLPSGDKGIKPATYRRARGMSTNADGALELSEELRLLQATVRRFMRQEIKPAEQPLAHDATQLPADVLKRLQDKARGLGLWCFASPAQYGGAGLSLLGRAVVAEEVSQCRMGLYIPARTSSVGIRPTSSSKARARRSKNMHCPRSPLGEKHFIGAAISGMTSRSTHRSPRCTRPKSQPK